MVRNGGPRAAGIIALISMRMLCARISDILLFTSFIYWHIFDYLLYTTFSGISFMLFILIFIIGVADQWLRCYGEWRQVTHFWRICYVLSQVIKLWYRSQPVRLQALRLWHVSAIRVAATLLIIMAITPTCTRGMSRWRFEGGRSLFFLAHIIIHFWSC